MPETFDASESDAILEAYQAAMQEPLPPASGQAGCLVALGAVAAFLVLPRVLDWLGIALPRSLGIALGAVLLAAALAGGAVAITGGGRRSSAVRARFEAALDALRDMDALTDQERHRAVGALLAHARTHSGPTTVSTMDLDVARERLGPALAYVEAAEHAVRTRADIDPVFTLDRAPPRGTGEAAG